MVGFPCPQAVDWWSVGVLTYELLTGASPFTVEGEKNTQQEITKRIVRCSYPVPTEVSPEVQDFIKKLLVKDPRKRLGGGVGDADELKRHPFFQTLDWEAVARREVVAPFVPALAHAADTCNFADEFTRMPPTDSPAHAPNHHDKLFLGYSYVAPSILFSENVISDQIWMQATGQKNDKLKGWVAKDSPFFQKYAVDLSTPLLGDGSYSVCRKCIQRDTGKEYAVKEHATRRLPQHVHYAPPLCSHDAIISSQKKDIKQEIELLKACQGCPYIITLHEVVQDSAFTYIVTELATGGELSSHLAGGGGGVGERVARRLLAQLACAVRHMQRRRAVHRDLKPECVVCKSERNYVYMKMRSAVSVLATLKYVLNIQDPTREQTGNKTVQNIMLSSCRLSEAKVKVVDFGFARRVDADERARMMTPCFSLPYAAPEVVARARSAAAPGYGAGCDMWSLGVIFYCMLCGKAPFQPTSKKEPVTSYMDRIRQGSFSMEGPQWEQISSDSKRLVAGLLAVEATRRLHPDDVLTSLGVDVDTSSFKLADMTKAELYKRRNKNKQRSSSAEAPAMEVDDPNAELLNTIKSRTEKKLHRKRPNTVDTPVEETKPQFEETEEIPPVKPVEKTYAKSRSKLDDYIYIESSQGLDETEVAFPKTSRARNLKNHPRQSLENAEKSRRKKPKALRSNDKKTPKSPKAKTTRLGLLKSPSRMRKLPVTRVTRKRKYEEIDTSKPVLREKGQNRASKTSVDKEATRKIARRKKRAQTSSFNHVTQNVRMTRSRMRRLEISLSPSQVKTIIPAFSFESDRRVDSVESTSAKTNAKGKRKVKASKAKTPRATRARGNRRIY
ncbi:LOW QUALITY PROTEIN: hypothetical protein MSG28_015603 [Choristoneura fumiferana]|uniref:Uncharacterized protein n=1 Tax=Choristoneura fumiferana TaxID=7141 RepID=A0ACC0KAN4_CHOFU|nr:LOW QUALITY PROTEIN: hypothetical protein MSG28_015603 [Choristoneura fumiferana]